MKLSQSTEKYGKVVTLTHCGMLGNIDRDVERNMAMAISSSEMAFNNTFQ